MASRSHIRAAQRKARERQKQSRDFSAYSELIETPHDFGAITDEGAEETLVAPANGRLAISCSEAQELGAIVVQAGTQSLFSHPALEAEQIYNGAYVEEGRTLDIIADGLTGDLSLYILDGFNRTHLIAGGSFGESITALGYMYLFGANKGRVTRFAVPDLADISTSVEDGFLSLKAPDLSDVGFTTNNAITFNDDGTKMYTAGSGGNTPARGVIEWSLSEAYNPSTATREAVLDLTAEITSGNVEGISFSADGTAFYALTSSSVIYQYTCATPYSLATATYASKSFSAATQNNQGTDIFFKPDGTKMYMPGLSGTPSIYQYTLSTPWDISTASYDSVSLALNTAPQNSNVRGMFISSDGENMLVCCQQSTRRLLSYTLGTPWNISTATIDEGGFQFEQGVMGEPCTFQGLFVTPDGLSVILMNEAHLPFEGVVKYVLQQPWKLAPVYGVDSFDVVGETTEPDYFRFGDDGEKLYIVSASGDTIYQYSLTAAYDLTTMSYDSKSFSLNAQTGTLPRGFWFKPDGTKLYVVSGTNDTVFQYTCSTPWDVSTASYDSVSFSVTTNAPNPQDLQFSADGTKMYVSNSGSQNARTGIHQYTLGTPWDVSTASYANKQLYTYVQRVDNPGAAQGFYITPDGEKLYVAGLESSIIGEFDLLTPDDISTATYVGHTLVKNYLTLPTTSSVSNVNLSADGEYMYFSIQSLSEGDFIHQVGLHNPFKVAQMELQADESFVVNWAGTQSSQGSFFKPDGTALYILDSSSRFVLQYSLSVPWDVETAAYVNKKFYVGAWLQGSGTISSLTSCVDVTFSSDGTKMYILESGQDRIHQYTLGTPWDVTTADGGGVIGTHKPSTTTNSFSVSSQEGNSTCMAWKADGSAFYVLGTTNDTVYQYTCGTPWDITTASYASKSFSVSSQDGSCNGLAFNGDGTKMYVLGTTNDRIYQYTLGTGWDVSTAGYDSLNLDATAVETSGGAIFFVEL